MPTNPIYSTRYLYDNSVWGDILTGTREITYNSRSNAPARNSVNSANDSIVDELFENRDYNTIDFSKSIFSNQNSSISQMSKVASVQSLDDSGDVSPITVDAIGNMLTYNGATFTWLGRQLQGISDEYNNISYSYDMDGRRVGKSVTGEDYSANYTYYYNGDILAGFDMTLDEGEGPLSYRMIFMYDESGEPFGFNCNGEDYYYVRNAQNDIYLIVDSNGYAQVYYQYDSWGRIIGGVDATDNGIGRINPLLYRGYYFDFETGFYYLKSRYYNPEFHRFINADGQISGVGGDIKGYNLFAYCFNNPVNMSDPTGNWPSWGQVFAAVATVAVAAVFVAAVVASAGAVGVAAGVAAASIGATGTMVSAAITVGTVGTYAVAAGIGACALSNAGEILTGTNVIRDGLMGGNQEAYDTVQTALNIAGGGAMILGQTNPGVTGNAAKPSQNAQTVHKVPTTGTPNTSFDKLYSGNTGGFQRTYYDFKGNVSLQIDFTYHNNPSIHSNPHLHIWGSSGRGNQINLWYLE